VLAGAGSAGFGSAGDGFGSAGETTGQPDADIFDDSAIAALAAEQDAVSVPF
jgi:hypothetical protein